MDKYRILFAPDGRHVINDRANDRTNPSEAVMAAREFCMINHQATAKVVNAETRFVIWDSEDEVKNHPDCWIAQARRKALIA
jgi:hypothetical protein